MLITTLINSKYEYENTQKNKVLGNKVQCLTTWLHGINNSYSLFYCVVCA